VKKGGRGVCEAKITFIEEESQPTNKKDRQITCQITVMKTWRSGI